MIRWIGLAPWEFEFPFPGSLTYFFLNPVPHTLNPKTLRQVLDTDAASKLVRVAGAHARGAGKAPGGLREPPKVRTRHIKDSQGQIMALT